MEKEKLDLTKILKDCPKGTKLYSPIFGEVVFDHIEREADFPICVETELYGPEGFLSDGKFIPKCPNGECLLFPSKDQRDWSKFVAPKPDLPEGTIVMCSDRTDLEDWGMRKYRHHGKVYNRWNRVAACDWKYIIPFDKFDPANIEECIAKNNYGTKQN